MYVLCSVLLVVVPVTRKDGPSLRLAAVAVVVGCAALSRVKQPAIMDSKWRQEFVLIKLTRL